jgi:hypothetical protein
MLASSSALTIVSPLPSSYGRRPGIASIPAETRRRASVTAATPDEASFFSPAQPVHNNIACVLAKSPVARKAHATALRYDAEWSSSSRAILQPRLASNSRYPGVCLILNESALDFVDTSQGPLSPSCKIMEHLYFPPHWIDDDLDQ